MKIISKRGKMIEDNGQQELFPEYPELNGDDEEALRKTTDGIVDHNWIELESEEFYENISVDPTYWYVDLGSQNIFKNGAFFKTVQELNDYLEAMMLKSD